MQTDILECVINVERRKGLDEKLWRKYVSIESITEYDVCFCKPPPPSLFVCFLRTPLPPLSTDVIYERSLRKQKKIVIYFILSAK